MFHSVLSAGSGINPLNVRMVVSISGCDEIHGSFSRKIESGSVQKKIPIVTGVDDRNPPETSKEDVASVVKLVA